MYLGSPRISWKSVVPPPLFFGKRDFSFQQISKLSVNQKKVEWCFQKEGTNKNRFLRPVLVWQEFCAFLRFLIILFHEAWGTQFQGQSKCDLTLKISHHSLSLLVKVSQPQAWGRSSYSGPSVVLYLLSCSIFLPEPSCQGRFLSPWICLQWLSCVSGRRVTYDNPPGSEESCDH